MRSHLLVVSLLVGGGSALLPGLAVGQGDPEEFIFNIGLSHEIDQGQRAPSGKVEWDVAGDLFGGTASGSIPIELPAGPGGSRPDLRIEYNSGRPWGALGPGWDLVLPTIRRSTRYGFTTATAPAESAVFEYAGQRLVLDGERQDVFSCNAVRYRTTPDNHKLITYCPAQDYWVVVEKNGDYQTFGRSNSVTVRQATPCSACRTR